MKKFIRRTKIITTLGPSTDKKDVLENLIKSGANVLRLNFSHGCVDDHVKRVNEARKIMEKLNVFVSILGDLQGPKIRISGFKKKKVFLNEGQQFILDENISKQSGDETGVGFNYEKLSQELFINDIILLDDGKIQLQVVKIILKKIITIVIVGGYLTDNKGLNKLGGGLSATSLTKKDKLDIILAAKLKVDYLAISFPRSAQDLIEARNLILKAGRNAKIVAKIERAESVSNKKNMKSIILASDAIMIARGDLGVEIGDESLVGIQKYLLKKARKLNRITIVATQMMESMIENSFPTRAEVLDVANSVLDGTDAVMLSAETASGKFPVKTVLKMSHICYGAEQVLYKKMSKKLKIFQFKNSLESIAHSAMYLCNNFKDIDFIVILHTSEILPLIASRVTSKISILYLSDCKDLLNFSVLYRGVIPIFHSYSNNKNFCIINDAIVFLKNKRILHDNSKILAIFKEKNINFKDSYSLKILKI